MRNQDIRNAAKEKGVRLWRVAERIGVTNSYFSVMLRKPFSDAERANVYAIIDQLAKEGEE